MGTRDGIDMFQFIESPAFNFNSVRWFPCHFESLIPFFLLVLLMFVRAFYLLLLIQREGGWYGSKDDHAVKGIIGL